MARRKKNIWQQLHRPSYERDAGRILYGEHDVERRYIEPVQGADGKLFGEVASEPVVHPILKRWIDALMAFDDHDKVPLIALLESGDEMMPIVGGWLADLVKRHGIKCDRVKRRSLVRTLKSFKPPTRTAGRPLVPAYDMSDRDAELYHDNEKVSDCLKTYGGTVDAAIAMVVSKKAPKARAGYAHTLALYRKGKHTSARRAAKRRT